MRATIILWLTGLLLMICVAVILSGITGCYGPAKAKKQFGRASVTYPELPADYCARVYPAKDSLIKGAEIVKTDTIWGAGEVFIVRDTLRSRDTVWIKTIERLPGQVITRTVLRTDTVYQENTAALDLCSIERRAAVLTADRVQKEADKWRKIAKKRFWVILGMGAGIALGIVALIRRKVTKKIGI